MILRKGLGIYTLLVFFALSALSAADEKKPAWDVNKPPYPTQTRVVDTREGTWMHLDISPDGKELLFDLLGDLYLLPIAGGEAKQLTKGIAWDMQPRFSPDGSQIAFTSDRAGGNNLWLMNRDGSNARALTKESFRLLNAPTWSPDGQWIAARKHFTAERSLGSGEIWLYHVSGGSGLQMTEKPNDEKDVNEPAFSRDGRYLFFTRDATSGETFEYNKDPSKGIYQIERYDRETGKTDVVIAGTGGAIRPTPSPDGHKLAFIRRDPYATALFTFDLHSGAIEKVAEGLDRDMQETWAIHGVYPSISWAPKSDAIFFWAKGKINRLDLANKNITNIPFHVKTTHSFAKALRFPVEVAPDRFPIRVLRWTQVTPKGDEVYFQALGKLYRKTLDKGTATRVTQNEGYDEYFPSLSRDGKSLVFSTWNDAELGTIQQLDLASGKQTQLTKAPGYYYSPVLSPDGKSLIYQRGSDGYLLSPLWSTETGLYRLDLATGEEKRLNEDGSSPQFGPESDRIYYLARGEKDALMFRSCDLYGGEVHEHAEWSLGQEASISPDGKWLAFTESFRAYLTPFPRTGKKVTLSPETTEVPVVQVSRDSGDFLHWNANSDRIYWSLADKLYHRELKEAYQFLAGASVKLPDPVSEGTPIGFEMAADKPKGKMALVGARIVTMKGEEVIEDGVILIENNRISAVGPQASIRIPADAKVIDVAGNTIIPGLVDVHAHISQGAGNGLIPQQNWLNFATLAYGVTTTHDPSNDTQTVFAAAEMERVGMRLAPRIFSTGTILYGATSPGYSAKVDSLEDALAHLRRQKAMGAFSVKSYNQPRRDQRQQIIEAGRQLKMMVVPEGGSLWDFNLTMVQDGHTGVEHCLPLAQVYDDLVQFWSKDVGYTPTLGVAYGGINGENFWYEHDDVYTNQKLLHWVPSFVLDSVARRRVKAPQEEYNYIRASEVAKKLTDAGVGVNLGAHGQREGLAAHWELAMMVHGGMTPHQALKSGTLNGAHYLGMDKDLGSIEAGKLADLVVLSANPLEDIQNSQKIRYITLNGRVYDAETLSQIAPETGAPKPFFWQTTDAKYPRTSSASASHVHCICTH